jgi:hypothetical protein
MINEWEEVEEWDTEGVFKRGYSVLESVVRAKHLPRQSTRRACRRKVVLGIKSYKSTAESAEEPFESFAGNWEKLLLHMDGAFAWPEPAIKTKKKLWEFVRSMEDRGGWARFEEVGLRKYGAEGMKKVYPLPRDYKEAVDLKMKDLEEDELEEDEGA